MSCSNCTCDTQEYGYEEGVNDGLQMAIQIINIMLQEYENKFMLPQADTCQKMTIALQKLLETKFEIENEALHANELIL